MQYEGFDWGFNPAGTPLGGESSRSMPGPVSIPDFGAPRQIAYDARREFSRHVQKTYAKVNPWNAGLWDPRGREALTENPSDYTDGMREMNATIKDFDAEADRVMNGGVREFGVARPNTNVSFDFLNRPATGLAPEAAAMLKAALEVMDPGVVDTIAVPNDIAQLSNINNELGFVTPNGGIPSTFLDQNIRVRSGPTLAEAAITSLATNQKPIEQVDENGIVFNKYSSGTGPYDAPGLQRPGGITGAIPGTAIGNDSALVQTPGSLPGPGGTPPASNNSISMGHVIGFVGLGLAGALGLGMLIRGATS